MDIGKAMKLMRKERGISQEALAKKLGKTTTTLSLIENGRKFPTTPRIKQICDGLGIKPIYLLLWALEKDDMPKGKETLFEAMVEPLRKALVEEEQADE